MTKQKLFTILTFCLSTVLLVYGTHSLFVTASFIKDSQKTVGTVMDLKFIPSRHSRIEGFHNSNYLPIISFQTVDGAMVRYTSNVSALRSTYDVGEKVEVLYDPEDPTNARINSFFDLWLGGIIPLGLVLILSLIILRTPFQPKNEK